VRHHKSKLRTFLLALAVVVFSATGNLLLAWGMKHLPEAMGINPSDYVRAILSPVVALGIALLTLWMLTRMTLMSWADLSVVLPITSFGYVAAALLGKLCLNEVITLRGWIGIAFIFVGSLVVGTTAHHHSHPSAAAEPKPESEVEA
jgi:uncharacterized membrane protein